MYNPNPNNIINVTVCVNVGQAILSESQIGWGHIKLKYNPEKDLGYFLLQLKQTIVLKQKSQNVIIFIQN